MPKQKDLSDEVDAGLSGDLGTLSDEEWREAHERLIATGVLPADETDYIWEPELDKSKLIGFDETEVAPTDG